MQINIDLHILKKILALVKQGDEQFEKVQLEYSRLNTIASEIRGLLEFIEGECHGKVSKKS